MTLEAVHGGFLKMNTFRTLDSIQGLTGLGLRGLGTEGHHLMPGKLQEVAVQGLAMQSVRKVPESLASDSKPRPVDLESKLCLPTPETISHTPIQVLT